MPRFIVDTDTIEHMDNCEAKTQANENSLGIDIHEQYIDIWCKSCCRAYRFIATEILVGRGL